MPGKDPQTYDQDEVCMFLTAIGLESKIDVFRENAVDGDMLVTLEADDWKELGLTGLQTKKIQRSIEFCRDLANDGGGGGGGTSPEDAAKMEALENENAALKQEVAELKSVLQAMQQPPQAPEPARAPAPAPPPPQKQHYTQQAPPPPQRREPGVIMGAGKGAAKGAALGAIAGAIAGDPSQGAKIGAALGGTAGGMEGLGNRRRARLARRF